MQTLQWAEAAVAHTRELVQLESTNPGTGEAAVANYLRGLLEPAVSAMAPDGGAVGHYWQTDVLPGRPILMAEVEGDGPFPTLTWICHMDTVPFGDGWTHDPLGAEIVAADASTVSGPLSGAALYGRGACDMKSGLACALTVFLEAAAQAAQGKRPQRSLRLLATMDEEGDMQGVEAALARGWIEPKGYVMDCEPTDGMIQTAHKGRYWYSLTIHGKAAHASKPEEGADAIAGMAYAIADARRRVKKLKKDRFTGESKITFGRVTGGTQLYQVPAECTVSVDMRLVPPYTAEDGAQILEEAVRVAAKEIPGLRGEIAITGDRPAIPHRSESPLLREVAQAVFSVTGAEADIAPFPGYTDTAVVAGAMPGVPTLSYGPGSLNLAHKPDEYVPLADIERCVAVYAKLAML